VSGGPYDVRPLNDVLVVQAAVYGGGSLIYANVQMRPPADVFDAACPAGYAGNARPLLSAEPRRGEKSGGVGVRDVDVR
jgi:hypothetical protein